jgi:aminopeptidase N
MQRLAVLFFILFSINARAQTIDVQHYKYEIELSDNSDAINGKAFITTKFLADAPIVKFDLVSGEDEQGMYVFQVMENSRLLTFTHRNNEVVINLGKPAKAGEVRTFEISYMGTPKDGLIISRNKYDDRTFFSDNWPNRAHDWIPCHDVPSDKASVEFIVTAPSHYKVISNGLLKEEKESGNNRKRAHWAEDLPIPTKVMVIGVADFAVARVDSSYPVPVTAWVYKQDSTKGVYDYALGDDILRFFESYIGPYPYKKLANVQSKTIFGGMENASTIFYAENTVTGTRKSEALMAHEIAHQWFGNTATEKDFAHIWLSEGFATYLTDLYIEQKYGVDSFQKRLQEERAEAIAFVKKSGRPVVDSVSEYMDLLNANSYQKGAWVLHMLRNEVGDSSFKKLIRAYYSQYKFGNADTRDFEKVAEAVAGKDLKWFFDQWLYQPGAPELLIQSKVEGDEVKGKIVQNNGVFRFPLEVGILKTDGKLIKEKVLVQSKETDFKFKMPGIKTVVIDPDTKLFYFERSR